MLWYLEVSQSHLFQQWVPDNWSPHLPIMYKVGLGMGYLELPQGEFKNFCFIQYPLSNYFKFVKIFHSSIWSSVSK